MALINNLPSGVYERDQESKGYYKVLLVGGRGSQSAEINEIQQIQDSQRSRLTNSIYSDGSLISGGFYRQDEDENLTIYLKESKINLQGYIFVIPDSTVIPNKNAESSIGIKLTKEFISSADDPELKNPVIGTTNYGSSGAMRLKYDAVWSAEPSDEDLGDNVYYYPLYNTSNGYLIQYKSKSSSEVFDTIARYDKDSNGSYIVEGMTMYYSSDEDEYHICGVSEGSAHVNGYEVTFTYSNPVNIRRALDEYFRPAEPIPVNITSVYVPRHVPISRITRIVGVKSITVEMTRGQSYGGVDLLPNTPVINVTSITQTSNGETTTYVKDVDFQIINDSIDWSLGGVEPNPNTSYTVSYLYQTTNVDYSISEDKSSVIINGLASGTTIYLDYYHYLQRMDRVVLHSNGDISVVEGSPSETNPIGQNVTDGLVLSSVLLRYGYEPFFYNDYYRAVRMSDLVSIKNAINNLQVNLAQLELRTDISATDPSSTKQGMFVDPFYDDDQRDSGVDQNAEIVDNILYPQRDWRIHSIREGGDITLDSSPAIYIEQPYRTKYRKINEFVTLSSNPLGFISIVPSTYRWTAKFTEVSQTVYKRYGTHKWHTLQETKVSVSVNDTTASYKVPMFTVSVSGTNFNSSETVDISIDGVTCGSFVTNGSGAFSGSVITPGNMKSGTKQVVATGRTSGCKAITTLSTIPQVSTRYVTKYYESDPVGQTFLNTELCMVSAVDIYFATKPVDYVEVAITETSSGFPDPNRILASKVLQKSEINTAGFIRFNFDSPVVLTADTYYSIIVISPESEGAIYVAELGQRDKWNNIWMSQNVFPSGTLVQASQLYTWSAVQNEDLTFRLIRENFNTGTLKENLLGTATISSESPVSQIFLLSDSKVYSDTTLNYRVKFMTTGEEYPISEYSTFQLNSKYSGDIRIYADISSENDKVSPVISGDVQLAVCAPSYPSIYVSRAFNTDGQYLKVYLDTLEYANGQIKVYYLTNYNSPKSSWVWQELDFNNLLFPTIGLGNNWVTKTYFYDTGSNLGMTRIKIEFNDILTSNINLPGCKNLRVLTNSTSWS